MSGDVWVSERDVQVYTESGWEAWASRKERPRGFPHPCISTYLLGYRPSSNTLAYGKPSGGVEAWSKEWTAPKLHEFRNYLRDVLSQDDFDLAASRLQQLENERSGLVSLRAITGPGLAALMYPPHSRAHVLQSRREVSSDLYHWPLFNTDSMGNARETLALQLLVQHSPRQLCFLKQPCLLKQRRHHCNH
jgi:hypothetical protein